MIPTHVHVSSRGHRLQLEPERSDYRKVFLASTDCAGEGQDELLSLEFGKESCPKHKFPLAGKGRLRGDGSRKRVATEAAWQVMIPPVGEALVDGPPPHSQPHIWVSLL